MENPAAKRDWLIDRVTLISVYEPAVDGAFPLPYRHFAPRNDDMHSNYPRMLACRPDQSFFLFGPRGTGKSTWTRTAVHEAHRVDLLDEATYQTLLAAPALLADELRAIPPGSWVVLDEVERFLNEIQAGRLWP